MNKIKRKSDESKLPITKYNRLVQVYNKWLSDYVGTDVEEYLTDMGVNLRPISSKLVTYNEQCDYIHEAASTVRMAFDSLITNFDFELSEYERAEQLRQLAKDTKTSTDYINRDRHTPIIPIGTHNHIRVEDVNGVYRCYANVDIKINSKIPLALCINLRCFDGLTFVPVEPYGNLNFIDVKPFKALYYVLMHVMSRVVKDDKNAEWLIKKDTLLGELHVSEGLPF